MAVHDVSPVETAATVAGGLISRGYEGRWHSRMSYETGGRASKYGDHYEDEYLARLLLRLVDGTLKSVRVEPLGEGHDAMEYIATELDYTNVYYQCKGSNGEQRYWRRSDLEKHDVFSRAKQILEQDPNGKYCFVSPLGYDGLNELCDRARTCLDAEEFVAYQLNSEKKKELFAYILKKWGLDEEKESDSQKAVFLLSRCYFETSLHGAEARKDLEARAQWAFVGPGSKTLTLLEAYANSNERYGVPITGNEIVSYMEKQEIPLRDISRDERMIPKIQALNKYQWGGFSPINGAIIHRKETDQAMEALKAGRSLIIHGKAGAGKSGCVEEIIQNLKEKDVLYLAIKLDKQIPTGTADAFGKTLGLLQSPVISLYALAAGKPCVLILDQLDSLRWTSVHSASALDVCKEMIEQAERINTFENGKISLIFVSRTFDLDTDQGLKRLFDKSDEENGLKWEKLQVGLLSDQEVKAVVGLEYDGFSKRLRNILQTPASLFVWANLEPAERLNAMRSSYQLVQEWWKQIQERSRKLLGQDDTVCRCKNRILEMMESRGELALPLCLFNNDAQAVDALVSMGLLVKNNRQLSFAHQSFLDCFMAENDLQAVYQGEQLADLFSSIRRQLPYLRHRFLTVLQILLDSAPGTFVEQARNILNSPQIHFYFKCAVFEVAGQCETENKDILRFVREYQNDREWGLFVFQTVFLGHPNFVRHYFDGGEPQWFTESGFALLRSIRDQAPDFIMECIAGKAFQQEAMDQKLFSVLCADPSLDTDEMFSLRTELFRRYPSLMRRGALYCLAQSGSPRFVPTLVLVLDNNELLESDNLYWGEEKEQKEIAKRYRMDITSVLFPKLCEATREMRLSIRNHSSDVNSHVWFKSYNSNSAAREMVNLVKLAFKEYEPADFLEYVAQKSFAQSPIANEIILATMEKLPIQFSDSVVTWLLDDFSHRIFVGTCSPRDHLLFAKKIIRKFSPYCRKDLFVALEETICHWKGDATAAREQYRRRQENNQKPQNERAYWAYWGHLQKALLPELGANRISPRARDLLQVLNRNKWVDPCYYNSGSWSINEGSIVSPVEGKAEKISDKRWLQIISVPEGKMQYAWKKNREGKTVETSPAEFASSLQYQAKKDPVRFAKLALSFPNECYPGYVTSVFLGIADPEDPEAKPDMDLICQLIRKYYRVANNGAAYCVLSAIKKNAAWDWPEDIYEAVRYLALKYPQKQDAALVTRETEEERKSLERLKIEALNCTRGHALYTLAALLSEHPSQIDFCKTVAREASRDDNEAVRFADVYLTAVCYKNAPAFAVQTLKNILSQDLRALGAPGFWNILCWDFEGNPEYYRNQLMRGCQSEVKDVAVEAASLLCAVAVFFHDTWSMQWLRSNSLSDEQLGAICQQAISTFGREEYKQDSEMILGYCMEASRDGLMELSGLFRKKKLDPEEDKDFILSLAGGKHRRILRHTFLEYLNGSDVPAPEAVAYLRAISEPCSDEKESWDMFDAPKLARAAVHLLDDNRGDENVLQTGLEIWDNIYRENRASIQRLSSLLDNME